MISRLRRLLGVAPIILVSSLGLTAVGCDVLTVAGTGTVTVTSNRPANSSIARLCSVDSPTCWDTDPYIYEYFPVDGDTEWTVYPGFPVFDRSGNPTGLPAGTYRLQAMEGVVGTSPVVIDVFGDQARDLTVWHQSYGRDGSEASCRSGWKQGWAQWPNDGTGGFVCNREIYAYYPDLPVTVPGASSEGTPWLQSLARASGDAPCPDGYSPGWAQWPNEGRGGAVCNRTIT